MKEYVEKFQSFGWRQARRYMNAHRVVSKLTRVHDIMPTFETQVRCLATCSEEEVNLIWERAVVRSRTTGAVIDRTLVEQIKKDVQRELYGTSSVPKVGSAKRKKAPVSTSTGSEASCADVLCGPQEPRTETAGSHALGATKNGDARAPVTVDKAQAISLPLIQGGKCLAWSSRQGPTRPITPLPVLVSVPETPPASPSRVDFLPECSGRAAKRPRIAPGGTNPGMKHPRERGFNQWVLAQELSAAEVLADMMRD